VAKAQQLAMKLRFEIPLRKNVLSCVIKVPSPARGEGNVNPSYKEKIGQTNQA
jgi:hypothetical protein